jgi:hypothetical protein
MPPQILSVHVSDVGNHRDKCSAFVWRYALGSSEPIVPLVLPFAINDQIPTILCVTRDEADKKMIGCVSIVVLRGKHIRAYRKQIVFTHRFASFARRIAAIANCAASSTEFFVAFD